MSIDPSRFREAIRTIHAGTLAVDEAEAIVALAQLAVDADGREDPDEIKTFFTAGKAIYELTGMPDLPTRTACASSRRSSTRRPRRSSPTPSPS
jgi:hypothetical protein